MTDITYSYSRPRREFSRIPEFQANEGEILTEIAPNANIRSHFALLGAYETRIQNVPTMSETGTNTERVKLKQRGQLHAEGGWPLGIDPTEFEEKSKYCKKAEREDGYLTTCRHLISSCTEPFIRQNNAIDIYGKFFPPKSASSSASDQTLKPPAMKTLTVFKDPSTVKRTAASVSWQNDGKRLAVAYCSLRYQSHVPEMRTDSYIWDLINPNEPVETLKTPTPLTCVEYYSKDPHIIAGGSWNGTVQYWDTRNPARPASHSLVEESHKVPVWSVKWLQSKTGEILSVSTDGNAFIWDCRLPEKPVEIHRLEDEDLQLQPKNNEGGAKGVLGGLCLDYDPQVGGPARYMVGTEEGTILSCNRKGKTQADKIGSSTFNGHHGPVYAVQRNPFFAKYFLSVGDWTARLWFEDFKSSSMFSSFYHKAPLTCGCWHPLRPGVFFTTRMDGYVDAWDLTVRQKTPVLSVQVADCSVHTARPAPEGRQLAVGSVDGSVSLLELSPSLYTPVPDEKTLVMHILENASARDKNLDRAVKERRAVLAQKQRRSTAISNLVQRNSVAPGRKSVADGSNNNNNDDSEEDDVDEESKNIDELEKVYGHDVVGSKTNDEASREILEHDWRQRLEEVESGNVNGAQPTGTEL